MTIEELTKDKDQCHYLGDGAYLTYREYDAILWTDRADEGGIHWVALEPMAVRNLINYTRQHGWPVQ